MHDIVRFLGTGLLEGKLTIVNMLTRKLELFGPLPENDKQFLDEVVWQSRSVSAATNIIREGDDPTDVHLVLDGFACPARSLRTEPTNPGLSRAG